MNKKRRFKKYKCRGRSKPKTLSFKGKNIDHSATKSIDKRSFKDLTQ